MEVLLGILGILLYFFPAIVARIRRKRNVNAITLLNLFAGWTVIGWVAALIWAAMKDDQPTS